MNDEDYEKQYGIRPNPNRFDSPEHISKALLDISQYESPGINHDSAKANLNYNELRQARADGYLMQELEEAELTCNLDLTIQKRKTFGKLGVLNVTSGAKGGWMALLSKTDKHVNIQSIDQLSQENEAEFNPQVEQSMLEKIPILGGFLKKKGAATNG